MASLEMRALFKAVENPVRMGRPAARAALREISNHRKRGVAKLKAVAVMKLKQREVEPLVVPVAPEIPKVPEVQPLVVPVVPVVPVAPVVLVVPKLPEVPQQLDVSMKEESALCQAFSEALLTVEDVDEQDGDQPQLCSVYVKDIYRYLHELELQQAVKPHYMTGYDINGRMRALLIDWLVQVHSRFQLLQETLYLTVAVLDRFLQVQQVSRRKLQLAGVTAMFVACKYEEMYAPEVGDFAYITDNAFSKAQILEMEQVVLRSLKFQLGRPLPLHFLRRASKVASSDVERHTLAKYLMELTLLDYDMVHFRPSEIAAAALCLSQLLLEGLPWSPMQKHYSTYDEAHLKPIVQLIAKNVVQVNDGKARFKTVKTKYSHTKLLKIALIHQLRSPVVQSLAAAAEDSH